MRIRNDVKVRQVAGENIIIMQDAGATDLTRVVGLNESSVLLFEKLAGKDFDIDDVVRVLCDAYEVDDTTARRDGTSWMEEMSRNGLLCE